MYLNNYQHHVQEKRIHYEPYLKSLARELRNNSTKTEVMLWLNLKGKQMCGYDFHRQKPIDKYIVDFFCNKLMLAIEIDGESHYGNREYDRIRQERLESLGIRFLRFENEEVFYNLDKVLNEIEEWIGKNSVK